MKSMSVDNRTPEPKSARTRAHSNVPLIVPKKRKVQTFKEFFKQFEKFYAFKEYSKEKNQFSIRYRSDWCHEDLDSLNPMDPREIRAENNTISSTQVKISKVKIIAIWSLIKRLM